MLNQTGSDIPRSRIAFAALGENTRDRVGGELQVTGTLPEGLSGRLYRNGPGLFRRGTHARTTLLDGDGVMQRLELGGGRAHYTRRFVRTPKFLAEERRGDFITSTWTTRAPRFWRNLGAHQVPSQAGVTTYQVGDTLYALDEVAPAFEIDPVTLTTGKPTHLGLPVRDGVKMLAHVRHLAASGDYLFVSTRLGARGMTIDIARQGADGRHLATRTVPAPRMVYVHDFAATERHVIFVLQPAFIHALRFVSGRSTFRDALDWQPEKGTVFLVVDLATGATTRFEAPATWVWHVANAYERGDEIIFDYVGYDDPWHFLGPDAALAAIMQGRAGAHGAPGRLRRARMNLKAGRLDAETLADGNVEFPSVAAHCSGLAHRRIFVNRGIEAGIVRHGIAAVDTVNGTVDAFDFGSHVDAGEPVFAPDSQGGEGAGWLITQILDTERGVSAFVVFDAAHVADGPIARVDLDETLPISFHGTWVARD